MSSRARWFEQGSLPPVYVSLEYIDMVCTGDIMHRSCLGEANIVTFATSGSTWVTIFWFAGNLGRVILNK